MRLVKESELKNLAGFNISQALRIPLTSAYILYGKSEREYSNARSREIKGNIDFNIILLHHQAGLVRGR
ncbi:MAG: hypothetical protein KKB21_00610 [Nanoarchaeota archaeon]|nr:hypothetical protein [Nanoarchaeota archaeon]MBU4086056.1 hypothetical protein [Nanoarchaeota archaeon]